MKETITKRIKWFFAIYFILVLIVVGKVIKLQYFSPTEIKAEDIAYRVEKVDAIRGDILSRDGRPIATSIPFYRIRIDCVVPSKDVFDNNVAELGKSLSAFFKDKGAAQYTKELKQARKEGKRYKALGNRLVDYPELMEIKKFPILSLGANRGGLIVEEKYKRQHPYGRLAYRTIGFTNTEGVSVGIEGSCDYYLKGEPGQQKIQKMLGGEWRPVNSDLTIEPKNGCDIKTTIDIDMQEAAEKALREQLAKGQAVEGATAIVMEVKTGAIRAIANMKKGKNGSYDESYNYAVGDATEPGSVFKLVTLVSLLEDGYVTLDSPVDAGNGKWSYGGHTYTDVTPGGYGLITVKKAFEKSSNCAFAKLAVEYYSKDPKKFTDRIQSMKVGERFNLDIQGEARSVIYTPTSQMWSATSLPSMAIGYATLLTPLHTLTFYNAIANNGVMMKPYFIESYQDHGKIIKNFPPTEMSGSIASERTIKAAQEAMSGVVEEGTGKSMKTLPFKVAGKTGTARMAFPGGGYERSGRRRYQASFAGFFPADNPKYSAIVILYSEPIVGNFYGGTQAGPVFKQIANHIYSSSRDWGKPVCGKDFTLDTLSTEKGMPVISSGKATQDIAALEQLPAKGKSSIMERMKRKDWITLCRDSSRNITIKECHNSDELLCNVVGMGLKDAIYILENQGYKVSFDGHGRVVSQNPAAGSGINRDSISTVVLKLEYN